ncbi:MAG: PHP domain-containing protein [Propioniciclava sp.]
MTRDPVADLRAIARMLERGGGQSRRAKAFRQAADTLAGLSAGERSRIDAARAWSSLPGVGTTTATAIGQSTRGRVPDYLADLEAAAEPLASAGPVRRALRGDLHLHTEWSDGCCPIEEMVLESVRLGHEYCAVTDHSPRLRVARGLSAERRAAQIDHLHALDATLDGFTVLAGIEVDILDDGGLDADAATLDRLDVVVASVHSKLAMNADAMTMRMVAAIANPQVNILGHVTGRLIGGERGTRGQSAFDAAVVFEACRRFGVAVEINSRPERQDPPDDLLALAAETGCLFSVDTDAHAPGQLEFCALGAARADAAGIAPDRVITTWPIADLRAWLSRARG